MLKVEKIALGSGAALSLAGALLKDSAVALACFGASLALLGVFVSLELKWEREGKDIREEFEALRNKVENIEIARSLGR